MLCSHCKKRQAKYEYTAGGAAPVSLCPECYRQLFSPSEEEEPLFDLSEEKSCPRCGTSLSEYRRTGLLGCAYCYTALRAELLSDIAQIHGKTEHEGSMPPVTGKTAEKFRRRQAELTERRDALLREGKLAAAKDVEHELSRIWQRLQEGGR